MPLQPPTRPKRSKITSSDSCPVFLLSLSGRPMWKLVLECHVEPAEAAKKGKATHKEAEQDIMHFLGAARTNLKNLIQEQIDEAQAHIVSFCETVATCDPESIAFKFFCKVSRWSLWGIVNGVCPGIGTETRPISDGFVLVRCPISFPRCGSQASSTLVFSSLVASGRGVVLEHTTARNSLKSSHP